MNVVTLIAGDFAAGAVLVSFGAVIGQRPWPKVQTGQGGGEREGRDLGEG